MKKFFENKPRAWFVIGAVLVSLLTIAGATYLFLNKEATKNPDVVAKIGGEEVLISEFKSWLYSQDNAGTSENPSKWDEIKDNNELKKYYLDTFVKNKVTRKEADSQSIAVTEQEIDAKYDVPTSNYENLSDEEKRLSRENVRAAIIEEKFENLLGWVSGDYIFYRFDKFYEYEDSVAKIDGAGDSKLISAQKAYAKKKAEEAYQRLSAGSSSIQSEVKTLESDPEISMKAFAPYTPHIAGVASKDEFLKDDSLYDPKAYKNFKASVENLEKGDYSAPFVVQGRVNGTFKDIAYVIFHAKEVSTGQYKDYKTWYESLLKKYKVEVYYSSIGITDVEEQKYSLASFLENVVPKAQAECTVDYVGLHRTQFKSYTYVRNNDGVTFTLWPGAAFTLQAGTSSASPKLQGYQKTDCAYAGNYFQAYKTSSSDGVMYSARADAEGAFLADCSSTSTAAIYAYKPTSSAWITNSGVLDLSNYNNAPNWRDPAAGEGTNILSIGINMAGFNGLTLIDEFTYSPRYKTNYTLTAQAIGPGSITGAGINCGAGNTDCTESYLEGTSVSLTAAPSAGSTFSGWSGCDSVNGPVCNVTMNASRTVTATFTAARTLSCGVSPQTGLAPLVVLVTPTATGFTNPSYDYDLDWTGVEGAFSPEYVARTTPVYYTYGQARESGYRVRIRERATNTFATCVPDPVIVTNPQDGTGNEVAP